MRLSISIAVLTFLCLAASASTQTIEKEPVPEGATAGKLKESKINPEELADSDKESDIKHGERAKKHICSLRCFGGNSGCHRSCGYNSGYRIIALNSMGALGSAGNVGSVAYALIGQPSQQQMSVPFATSPLQSQFGMVPPIQQAPMQVVAPANLQQQYQVPPVSPLQSGLTLTCTPTQIRSPYGFTQPSMPTSYMPAQSSMYASIAPTRGNIPIYLSPSQTFLPRIYAYSLGTYRPHRNYYPSNTVPGDSGLPILPMELSQEQRETSQSLEALIPKIRSRRFQEIRSQNNGQPLSINFNEELRKNPETNF